MAREDPRTVEQVHAWLASSLEASFDDLERWLDVPEVLWRARPRPEAWSVGEVCEHVALTDHFLLLLVEKIAARARKRLEQGTAAPGEAPSFEALEALASREFRWAHPEHMAPGGAAAREELRARYATLRERCLAPLRELPPGAGSLHAIRMSVVGAKLDLYQFLRLVELHHRRHLAQMERARAALNG